MGLLNMPSLAPTIEAILYLKGQPLELAAIAEYAGCDSEALLRSADRAAAVVALIELMADYAHRDSALEVVETPGGYSLQLRASFENLITRMIPAELGTGALRTLAAIALSGSISQPDLVNLRGSGAYQHVQELVDLGFVRKRRQSGGRSYWLQVTDKFHQNFQVEQMLPPLEQHSQP